jgi:hypothetical protein
VHLKSPSARSLPLVWVLLLTLVLPGLHAATAAAGPTPLFTYLPAGFVSSVKTAAQVDGYLADLDTFGINQGLLNLPAFNPKSGKRPLSKNARAMIALWVARTAAFDTTHPNPIAITAVFNGRLDKGLNPDDVTMRANMVAAIKTVVALGVTGVQLDLEPYPTTTGLLSLLDEIRTSLTTSGLTASLSIVAPAVTTTWSPAFLQSVSTRVDEVDPTYYDSTLTTVASYEAWVAASLAYYSTNTAATARIVPVIPSYRKNRWHTPAVENITTATDALTTSLAANSRVDGAGLWWWWGFFYGEGGKYNPAADQTTWQSTTRGLNYN